MSYNIEMLFVIDGFFPWRKSSDTLDEDNNNTKSSKGKLTKLLERPDSAQFFWGCTLFERKKDQLHLLRHILDFETLQVPTQIYVPSENMMN